VDAQNAAVTSVNARRTALAQDRVISKFATAFLTIKSGSSPMKYSTSSY
jgi:hypothetical protein